MQNNYLSVTLLIFIPVTLVFFILLIVDLGIVDQRNLESTDLSSVPFPQFVSAYQEALGNKSPNKQYTDSEFTKIFNEKNLEGWKMSGGGNYIIVAEEKAIQSNGGLGILWYTKEKYGNFVLKIDWKVSKKGDNSGVFVRFPNLANDPNVAVRKGYEIQINDKGETPLFTTGAIANFTAPRNVSLKPPGQWNTMIVQALDQLYTVFINEEKVLEFTGDRLTEGYVGLQAHDPKSKVSFRNIMTMKLN